MTDEPQDNLEAKVREIMFDGGEGGWASEMVDIARSEPRDSLGCTRDRDLIDWGLACGIAYATACLVAPNEDREQSASRALLIALAISREWGGEPIVPPRPDLSPLLDDVLVEHYNSGMALYGVAEDLDEALIRLEQAFGVPREVTA